MHENTAAAFRQAKDVALADAYAHRRYVIRKRVFRMIGSKFPIYGQDMGFHVYGPEGECLFSSEQKVFRRGDDICLYAGEDTGVEALLIRTKSDTDSCVEYEIIDSTAHQTVGGFRREVVGDRWMILDTEGHEIGYIEGTGEAAVEFDDCEDGVNSMRPREYTGYVGEQAVGTFRHEFNPFVFKTNADFSLDANRLLDKRMGIAAAVLLCAVEGRQQGKAKDFDPS